MPLGFHQIGIGPEAPAFLGDVDKDPLTRPVTVSQRILNRDISLRGLPVVEMWRGGHEAMR